MSPHFEERIQSNKGGCIDIHAQCDANKKAEHIMAAIILANRGHKIELLPEIPPTAMELRNQFFPELHRNNFKNPDARFDGMLADFKIPDSDPVLKNNINKCIYATAAKEVPVCIISLLHRIYDLREVMRGLQGDLKPADRNKSITEVWVVLNDRNVIKIPRKMIRNKDFFKIIDAF